MGYKVLLMLLASTSQILCASDDFDVKVYDIPSRVDPVFLRVRDDIAGGGLLLRSEPNTKAPIVMTLPSKSIIQINLTFDEIIAREKNERSNIGSWQKITVSDGRLLYFYDYWQNLTTLFSTSRGLALLQRKNSGENLFVFNEIPKSLNLNCESPSKSKDNSSDNNGSGVKCFAQTDRKELIYLIESKIANNSAEDNSHSSSRPNFHLFYHIRFVKDEVNEKDTTAETVEYQGWVFARQLDLRLDSLACQKEVCLNSALLANHPEDAQSLFFELGYIKRPTKEKQIFDANFFAFKKNNQSNEKGVRPFNRWLDRMAREIKDPEKYDEVEYLLKVRPLWLLGAGYSYYNFDQTGGNGDMKLSESGPTLLAGLTFPLLLDLELLVKGTYTQSEFKISSNTQDKYNPVDITNDLIITVPFKKYQASYFLGPGMTFRAHLNSSGRVGYNTLYGVHLATGFFYGTLSGYANFGFTTAEITGSLSHPEWQLALGHTLNYTSKGAWSSWLQHASFDAVTRDKNALTGSVKVTNYQSTRTTLSIHYDF